MSHTGDMHVMLEGIKDVGNVEVFHHEKIGFQCLFVKDFMKR